MSGPPSASTDKSSTQCREVYEGSHSGAQERPYIPRLRSDPPAWHWLPRTLAEYREKEGKQNREARLRALWESLPKDRRDSEHDDSQLWSNGTDMDSAHATRLWYMYEDELMNRCSSNGTSTITWPDFLDYADKKEAELWTIFHDKLDLDNNGHLDADELCQALGKAEVHMSPATLNEFMTFLTSSSHSHPVSFPEFRDFLLLLPRPASTIEIYRYYKVRKFFGKDGRGAARVNMEGDVSLSAEDRPQAKKINTITVHGKDLEPHLTLDDDDAVAVEDTVPDEYLETKEDDQDWVFGHTARYLLAGGIAGAVSRTATAPFDRLKIFLITRPPDLGGLAGTRTVAPRQGIKALGAAVMQLYMEGGIRAFWLGNGLNLVKIFPESAVKFMTYEQTKRVFAMHWDHVEDPRNISGGSRFLAGGIGGIVSQLFIYPIETLKTQMMSSIGDQRTVASSMRRLWSMGRFPAYYRGLTIGIVGVFPYSAIDMSTFEALKLAYLRSTGKDEPGVLAILAFGSISGSIGATSVYPLNLVRTRLQASGSSGHPQIYTGGAWDVASKTLAVDGWRGFYRGLFPTLAKVVPSVSISYVVYENTKRRLGV